MDSMDKKEKPPARWDWLPAQMPGVVALMADKRRELGAAWVNECWRRGVLAGEPGWFFASEGSLMVGTLWDHVSVIAFASARISRTQALIVLKPKEAANGAD
jgi:hypothetical protein